MAARRVRISIGDELLKQVDATREARLRGRSAYIRHAIQVYLELATRCDIDSAYAKAYGGTEDAVFDEFAAHMAGQAWPAR